MNASVDPNVEQQSIGKVSYYSDLRTGPQKLIAAIRLPSVKAGFMAACAIFGLIAPYSILLTLPLILVVLIFRYRQEFPAYAPRHSKLPDKFAPKDGTDFTPTKAAGDVYLGWHRGTSKQLWLTWSQLMMHVYILGTTGSGKTEAIWLLALNALSCGSSFSFGDGKGTFELLKQGWYLNRRFGVESDYLIINFNSGSNESPHGLFSNTTNTFNSGTSAELKEIFASLSLSGDAGQNQYFEDVAVEILERLFPAMVELRDKGLINLDIQKIGSYLPLHRMYDLATHPEVSIDNSRYLNEYLERKGFDPSKGAKQHPDVINDHQKFISHFGKTITSLSIQYRSIFMTDQGEINQRDILSNRRGMVFSLPSLEKSGGELKNLGKIILSAQKNAVNKDAGDRLEGTIAQTTAKLSSHYKVPYLLINDEWSFWSIQDMSLIPAQVRNYRYCAVYGAQDYAGTKRASEIDAESTMGNCRTKLFGALEAAGESWEKIREVIGEVRKAVHTGYKYLPGMFGGRKIIDYDKIEITKTDAVEMKEMQALKAGQFFIEIFGKVSPIKLLYVDLNNLAIKAHPGHTMKINRFLRVYAPPDDALEQMEVNERFIHELYKTDISFIPAGRIADLKASLREANNGYGPVSGAELSSVLSKFIERHAVSYKLNLNSQPVKRITNTSGNEESASIASLTTEESSSLLDAFGMTPTVDPDTPEAATPGTVDDADNEPVSVQKTNALDAKTPTTNNSTADTLASNSTTQVAIDAASDPLLSQTLEAKRLIETAQNASVGASILSEAQSDAISKDLTAINTLLGMNEEAANELSSQTIEKIRRHCYYLAPPRPQQIDKSDISDLQARVDSLLADN